VVQSSNAPFQSYLMLLLDIREKCKSFRVMLSCMKTNGFANDAKLHEGLMRTSLTGSIVSYVELESSFENKLVIIQH